MKKVDIRKCKSMREKDIMTCRYCGETFLHWVKIDVGWRLFDVDNLIHKCEYFNKKEDPKKKPRLFDIVSILKKKKEINNA